MGLLLVGVARDPRVGPLHLPTFGLPSLGLMTPPPPSVLGAEASPTGTEPGASETASAKSSITSATPAVQRSVVVPTTRPNSPAPPASNTPATTPSATPFAPLPTTTTTAPP